MADSVEIMTSDKIVWAVISHLMGGLQAVSNHPFSEELIADEIDNIRLELIKNPKILAALDFRLISQSVGCIDVQKVPDQECVELGFEGYFWRTKDKLPKMLTIPGKPLVDYIGAANWMQRYDVISMEYLDSLRYDKYPVPVAFWMNDYFYFAHLPKNTEVVAIRAPFERPTQIVKKYSCCKDNSYPIPGEFVQGIIRNLVDNYVKYGYFRNPQPNTQAFIPQPQGGAK